MRPGQHRLPAHAVRRFALLMQLHHLTEATRIAQRYGVSAEYVRLQWRELQAPDMEAMWRRLEHLLPAECGEERSARNIQDAAAPSDEDEQADQAVEAVGP